jgi:DNA-binding Lrp family transcriptional regulator
MEPGNIEQNAENVDETVQAPSVSDIIADLDSVDKAIIQLIIESPKITNIEIGERLNLHRTTIGERLKKVKLQQALAEVQKSALQILLDNQAAAARRLAKIVKTGNDGDATRAAKEILKGVLVETVEVNARFEKSPEQDEAVKSIISKHGIRPE